MRTILKSLLALIVCFAASQSAIAGESFSASDQSFEKVYEARALTKDQIFSASKIWVAENFKSAKAVVEYESKDEGTLIGNGLIKFPCKGVFDCLGKADWKVRFTMRVDMKDGKFRLTFPNIGLVWPAAVYNRVVTPANDGGPVYSQKDRDKIQAALLLFGPEMQIAMANAPGNDDW
jgi:hypothetical protein